MTHQFWIIWSPGEHPNPRYRHDSYSSAITEAKRLAAMRPGQEFYVMAAEARAVYDAVRVDEFRSREIPF